MLLATIYGIASVLLFFQHGASSPDPDAACSHKKVRLQLDVRFIRPLQLCKKKFVHIKPLSVFEHKIHGSPKLVGQYGKGFALAVLVAYFAKIPVCGTVSSDKELSRLGKSPAQMGVADLLAGCAVFFAVGLFGAFHQTAV